LRRTAFVAVRVSNLLAKTGDCFDGRAPSRNDMVYIENCRAEMAILDKRVLLSPYSAKNNHLTLQRRKPMRTVFISTITLFLLAACGSAAPAPQVTVTLLFLPWLDIGSRRMIEG